MKSKRLILLIFAIYVIFSGILLLQNNKVVDNHFKVIDVNDLVRTIEESWDKAGIGDAESRHITELAVTYNMGVAVLDLSGMCLYKTKGMKQSSIKEAIEHGDTIMDLCNDGSIEGKIILSNLNMESQMQQTYISRMIIYSTTLVGICLILYMLYLDRKVIAPFQKLNRFARNVAAGNLDTPLEMDRENIFGAFTESFDIMREQLYQAREKEREANESKKELVASLSHDIKTPLASIRAMSELLEITLHESKQLEKVQAIQKKAIQIEQLTNNLFHSTLEELQTLKVNVKEEESLILDDIISTTDYRHLVANKHICECIICCDRLRLEQVFDNVIANSYKYANTKIDIVSRVTEYTLEIRVRDYGQGVSTDDIPLLTRKFYRGQNAEGKMGAGIGLYMSHYFMEQMGGSLIANNYEVGFEVVIEIPLTMIR